MCKEENLQYSRLVCLRGGDSGVSDGFRVICLSSSTCGRGGGVYGSLKFSGRVRVGDLVYSGLKNKGPGLPIDS